MAKAVGIDLGISIALVPTDDRRVEVTLATTGERDGFDLDAIGPKRSTWIDYVAGTAWALHEAGLPTRGFRGLLASDLPQGSGLSSSAALELASALALSGGGGYLNGSALARAYRDVRAGAFMHPLGANRAYDVLADVALDRAVTLR